MKRLANTQEKIDKKLHYLLFCSFIAFISLSCTCYAKDSSVLAPGSAATPARSYILGSGSGHVGAWGTQNIGSTPVEMGICNPPYTLKLTWGLIGIDDAGGGCYDKWISTNVTATVQGTAPNQYYQITGWGVVNTPSGCSDAGFTVSWMAICSL